MEKENYVYLMKDLSNGYYKIGRSNDVFKREKTLQAERPTICLLSKMPCDGVKNAVLVEKRLHLKYKSLRLRGEWFRLPIKEFEEVLIFFQGETFKYENKLPNVEIVETSPISLSIASFFISENEFENFKYLKNRLRVILKNWHNKKVKKNSEKQATIMVVKNIIVAINDIIDTKCHEDCKSIMKSKRYLVGIKESEKDFSFDIEEILNTFFILKTIPPC